MAKNAGAVVFEEPVKLGPSYQAPYTTARGDAESSLFHPEGYSLWKLTARLGPGAELEWGSDHGDEGIFVVSGALEHDGKRCGTDGVILVEAGVPATVRALGETELLHFGPTETAPPAEGPLGGPSSTDHRVHVIPFEETEPVRAGFMTFYSDGSCPSCRIALFTVDRRNAPEPRNFASHLHSEDEIIHILDGSINVGPVPVAAGQGVAVPGERRYGFRSPGPLRFINYRRDISTVVHGVGSEPELETLGRMHDMIRRNDPLLQKQE